MNDDEQDEDEDDNGEDPENNKNNNEDKNNKDSEDKDGGDGEHRGEDIDGGDSNEDNDGTTAMPQCRQRGAAGRDNRSGPLHLNPIPHMQPLRAR